MIRGISDRATFAELRSTGVQVRTRDLRVRFLGAGYGDDDLRVAFAIPRRVGSAVTRNRIRRRIRGVLEEFAASAEPFPSGAALFAVHSSCRELRYHELRSQVREVTEKLEKSEKSYP